MRHELIGQSFKVDGVFHKYSLTKKQLSTAIQHGGTKRSNDYIDGGRHMRWVDNNTPIGKSLPSNKYSTTRVIVKNNSVIVYLPYYVSSNEPAQHIAIFDRKSLKLIEASFGSGTNMPYVICTDKGCTLATYASICQDITHTHINHTYSDLSKLMDVLGVA